MKKSLLKYPVAMFFLLALMTTFNANGVQSQMDIKKTDHCPVCGMLVDKDLKWAAKLVMKDGTYYAYDGVKDMLKHYFNIPKYTPKKTADGIKLMTVTDYYDGKKIDAKSAYYVIGSDVLGPMGPEFIPFKDESSAQEFMNDHKGKSVLRFQDITMETVSGVESGH